MSARSTHKRTSNIFNAVHYPCNYITYLKRDTKLLHKAFHLLINAPTRFGLNVWPSSGSSYVFSKCRLCSNLYGEHSTCVVNYPYEDQMLQFLKSVLCLKYKYNTKYNYYSFDIIVASKPLLFSHSSNEVSSGIKYPVSYVRLMNEYAIACSFIRRILINGASVAFIFTS